MNTLKDLVWEVCPEYKYPYLETTHSPTYGYIIIQDKDMYKVSYYHLSGGVSTIERGFATIDCAKKWCFRNYQECMKPWLNSLTLVTEGKVNSEYSLTERELEESIISGYHRTDYSWE